MYNLSPIILFTYLRLETLQKTINALAANLYAADSDLIIFSDGAKYKKDELEVRKIRTYLKKIEGFKSVIVHESRTNKGLGTSIIQGVSSVLKVYPSAIVLEDDLITSSNFLAFMNQSLIEFENQMKVYSISGYSFDFNHQNVKQDAYFLNRTWTWGWATWADRWNKVDWEMKIYSDFEKDPKCKLEFSKLGSDVNFMLKRQMQGEIDSWGIRFIFHQFIVQGLTLYPKVSKVNNNGFDQFATHTLGIKDRFETSIDVGNQFEFLLPNKVEIDTPYQNQFLAKFNLLNRILNKIKELLLR